MEKATFIKKTKKNLQKFSLYLTRQLRVGKKSPEKTK
jgi:hypothetical protein